MLRNKLSSAILCTTSVFLFAANARAATYTGSTGLLLPDVEINFSHTPSISNNTLLTTQFAGQGIELSGFYYNSLGSPGASPDGASPDINNFSGGALQQDLRILFNNDATDFLTNWYDIGGVFEMSSYRNGVLQENFDILTSNKHGFLNSLFDEVRISADSEVILDNFQFNYAATSVPEPSSVALLVAFAGAFAGRHSCRKRTVRNSFL